jgi:type IV pilus assembly protein PilW
MKNDDGFTLTELLVAMAVTGVVMAGIYSSYHTQQKSYLAQEQVVGMQQNLRAAMYSVARSVRMAGYDPLGSANSGFVSNFPAPYDTYGVTTDASNIACTSDDDDSGAIDNNSSELLAYRLNDDKLQVFSTGAVNWQDVAENIDALNFVYLNEDGDPTATLADIRSVQITIVARTAKEDPGYINNTVYRNQQTTPIYTAPGDNNRRNILTAQIQCRNLNFE